METLITSITEGQKKQYKRFVEDAADKALIETDLDKDGLQRVIENGDDLQAAIVAKLRELSVTNEYANEEGKSNFGYLSGYTKPVEITDQVDILRSHWPSLNPGAALHYYRKVYPTIQYPRWVEGPFALIRPGFFSDKYGEELEEVLKAIKKDRNGKFYNWREGQTGPQYLRQTAKAARAFQKLGDEQKDHDILVVPAQFGLRHRGRSVRRARAIMNSSEFGLGAFAVGIMILTHPERLKHFDDLWIDCAGDEYSPAADGVFSNAPVFSLGFGFGRVSFFADWVGSTDECYGSASGFVSQSRPTE